VVQRPRVAIAIGGVAVLAAILFAVWHDDRADEATVPSDPAIEATCKDLLSRLPDTVAGQRESDVSDPDTAVKTWGEPPIVLRCGVSKPAALSPTSQCLAVNDIDWFASAGGQEVDLAKPPAGTVDFTTVGRTVNVQVSVPDKWSPASDALVDVSDAITRTTRPVQDPCE
jgi:hypothetical protein